MKIFKFAIEVLEFFLVVALMMLVIGVANRLITQWYVTLPNAMPVWGFLVIMGILNVVLRVGGGSLYLR
jgi:hypothetical protein